MRLIPGSAVVTGSTKGIGYAIANRLLARGADVAICGRAEADVRRAAAELQAAHPGRRVLAVAADVTRAADIERLLTETEAALGPISILVNNAGGGGVAPIAEMTEDEWNAVVALNLTSVFLGTRGAIRRMRASGTAGSIINISSVETYGTTTGNAHYTASKAGVAKFTQVAALEAGRLGIRVNTVSPGVIRTPLTEAVLTPAFEAEWRKTFAIDRFGMPNDVADAVVFLASEQASWVTGTDLLVDGGTHLRGLPDFLEQFTAVAP
jgi:3-oxoacyl-[acyl-carrier protein] reductase